MLIQNNKNYIQDLYLENYTYPIDIHYKKDIINNTLNFYLKYHPTFNINAFNQLSLSTLEEIIKHDKVIKIENQIIYKELYKIIWLINITFEALKFINQSNYPKKYFADIQSDKKKVTREKNRYKNIIISNNAISSKGELRVNWYFYTLFKKNKDLLKFFLNIYTLTDITKASLLYTENEDTVTKILKFFNDKLIQKTTPKALIKNLGILLHYEFKNYLKVKDTKSKELISEIIPYVFDEESPNDEEFNNYIYLSSTLSFLPIFGSSKKNPYPVNKQKQIKSMFIKILKSENPKTRINHSSFTSEIKGLLESSHIIFLQKYPLEFFRINPKYSSLIKK